MAEIIEPAHHQEESERDMQAMAQKLTRVIEEGQHHIPEKAAPLVCKPTRIESWRLFKIMAELTDGFDLLSKYGLAASIFGTARMSFEEHFYKEANELAGKLAKAGFAIVTGGSAGIMEASNKGAYEAGGASVGLNIDLGEKQGTNKYLTDSITFEHFFVRKVMLTYASEVYIYFPGGFGTLDEFFEILTLIQTEKIKKVPIVLYGREYWTPLIEFFKTKLLGEHNAIDSTDMNLFVLVDSVEEAFTYITANVKC